MSASSSAREEEPMLKSTLVTAGIVSAETNVYFNLSSQELQDHSVRNNEGGMYTANGTYAIDTGKFTGRSPKDKYFVCQEPSSKNIWWGNVNRPITEEIFNELYELCVNHFRTLDKVYVYDGYCGASRTSQKSVRFITELAWMSHFVKNMFIDADFYGGICKGKGMEPGANFLSDPDFTIINACKVVNHKWESQGLNSENFIAFNIERKIAVIGGTSYGGEMKKGMFSMMNYWLPLENVMTIHCSANKGFSQTIEGAACSDADSNTALFFGLSGTGKTTLSTDPNRKLIGDDEIGWNSEGIFNLEGGCYAKTINLSEVNEPDIFRAIRPGALLENVEIHSETKIPDYYNIAKTENGRVSYPLSFIDNYEVSGGGKHPKNIIFLTCDAFGIFPPISLLTSKQAIYYFLSGYTSKVAGTERGVTEPQAVFSSCFGEAFLTLHPSKYADLLSQKLDHFESIDKINVYLVNTGWIGGAYGVGKRMNIKDTRACIDAIFNGTIVPEALEVDPVFGISYPKYIVGDTVPPHILNPRESWSDKAAYDEQRIKLAGMFINNYEKFIDVGFTDYSAYGPKLPN